MTYTKTTWKDRVVEKPRNYTMANNADGSVTLTPSPGVVTEAGTPIIAANLNNIEEGIADAYVQLTTKVTVSLADATYYVNASSGSDSNNGTTSGTAFKTIAKAMSLLPQIINHNVTINVATGTYNETVKINGYNGSGIFTISGVGSTTIIQNFQVIGSGIFVTIQNISTSYTSDNIVIKWSKCVFVNNCTNQATITGAAFVSFYASAGIVSALNVNYAYIVVLAVNGSTVRSYTNNSGTGNTTALRSESSIIFRDGTQPSATTATVTYGGGQIF